MAGSGGVWAIVWKHRSFLGNELDFDKILPELLKQHILSNDEYRQVRAPRDPRRRMQCLLETIPRRGSDAVNSFLATLQKFHPKLLSVLLMMESNEDPSCNSSPPPAAPQDLLRGSESTSYIPKVNNSDRWKSQHPHHGLRGVDEAMHMDVNGSAMNSLPKSRAAPESPSLYHPDFAPPLLLPRRNVNGASSRAKVSENHFQHVESLYQNAISTRLETSPDGWETHTMCLRRVSGYGFGIAVSGGRDNPHFPNGDPAIAISDVLPAGPAEGRLQLDDRLLSVNGISLENVDHVTAISVLRDSGDVVTLVVQRKLTPSKDAYTHVLLRKQRQQGFGMVLGYKLFIKDIIADSPAAEDLNLTVGCQVLSINGNTCDNVSLNDAKRIIEKSKDRLELVVQPDELPLAVAAPSSSSSMRTYDTGRHVKVMSEPRFISFQKDGGVGIRVSGGNKAGIYVAAVALKSPAYYQGILEGDLLIKVNGVEFGGLTREEAVLFLLSLQEQVSMLVQHKKLEYDKFMNSGGTGDSFYIKVNFDCLNPEHGEMSFRRGDVFHVEDTLYKGVVGSWQACKVIHNQQQRERGILPNRSRADQLSRIETMNEKESRNSLKSSSFFRKKVTRRAKSLGRDHWDDVFLSQSNAKFPAYERVLLRESGFVRPLIIFGPLSDVARENLIADRPDLFESPESDKQQTVQSRRQGIIRLGAIRAIMEQGKHCVLDVTPNAVQRLVQAQYCPITVYLKADSKQAVKDLRMRFARHSSKNSKKLYEQSQKLEKSFAHFFTDTIPLTNGDSWFRNLQDTIEKSQKQPMWLPEQKTPQATDNFLLPMSSRLSFVSSPENDHDMACYLEPRRLTRSTSDPSINTHDAVPGIPPYPPPPGYSRPVQQYPSSDPKSLLGESNYQPESVYYPGSLNSYPQQLSVRPLGIDAYATLTPAERRYGSQPQKGDSAFPVDVSSFKMVGNDLRNPENSSLSSDSYSKYMQHPLNQHDDSKLEQKNKTATIGKSKLSGLHKYSMGDNYNPNGHLNAAPESGNTDGADDGHILSPASYYKQAQPAYSHFTDASSIKQRNYENSTQHGGNRYPIKKLPSMHEEFAHEKRHIPHEDNPALDGGLYDRHPQDSLSYANSLYMEHSDASPIKPLAKEDFANNNRNIPNGAQLSSYSTDNKAFASDEGVASDRRTVLAAARGVFDHGGGVLESKETGVSIIIPTGAISPGRMQEIHFKVCQDDSILPPLNKEKGETLLSPLVMCGPQGLRFNQPVELRLPHCASVNPDSWSFSLKSSDLPTDQPTQWQNMALAGIDGIAQGTVGKNSVSVLVDHF